MRPSERIAAAFGGARAAGRRAAFMPYMMGGFPTPELARSIGAAYVAQGADLIELGMPCSDPLADGPVIQSAGTRALGHGTRLDDVLALGAELAVDVPVVLMVYANLVLQRGFGTLAGELSERGFAGMIVPDLPLEESSELRAACDDAGVALVPLVAPTTPDRRLAEIGAQARGFLYTVSVKGITGERAALADAFTDTVARAAAHTDVPVALGFGISTPTQVSQAAAAGADGVIVGSRLVREAAEAADPASAVADLVAELTAGLRASEARG